MTAQIVGEAALDIRAVGDHFAGDVNRVVTPGARKAGDQLENAAGRGKKAFGLMWGSFNTASMGAMGPVIDMVSHVQSVADQLMSRSRALQLTAVGAAGVGIGTGLQAFASREQQAAAQLEASYQTLNHTSGEYQDQIDRTVKHGEKFGIHGYETIDVLNRLTVATRSPAKAFADYQVVLDMAAARHISVTTAAQMLASAYAGNTRVFRMFGISVADANKVLATAAAANKSAATASEKLATARQNLKDVEARIADARTRHAATADQLASAEARVASATASVQTTEFKHGQASPQAAAARARLAAAEAGLTKVRNEGTGAAKLTVAQEIELRKAHDALTKAQKEYAAAAAEKVKADKAAKGASTDVNKTIAELADRLNGQAVAAADNFAGHMRQMGAEIEDDVAKFGGQWGPAITTASTGVLAMGTTLTVTGAVVDRFRGKTRQAAAEAEGMGKSAAKGAQTTESELAQMETSGGASLGKLAGAVAGVAAAIGVTAAVGSATSHAGTAGAVATTLTGALSGAVAGLSVGGPFGAAVGGAVGAIGGLATHFHDAASQVSGFDTAVKTLSGTLKTALVADQAKIGAQTSGALTDFMLRHPEAAQTFAKYGFGMPNLVQYLQSGGKQGLSGTKLASEFAGSLDDQGKVHFDPGVPAARDALAKMLAAFGPAFAAAQAINTLNTMPLTKPTSTSAGLAVPGASASHTASQLSSIHGTLLQIQHNTAKGTHATEDLHTTVRTSERSRGAGARSPELMTL